MRRQRVIGSLARCGVAAAELGLQKYPKGRILRRYVYPDGAASGRLVMGVTELGAALCTIVIVTAPTAAAALSRTPAQLSSP